MCHVYGSVVGEGGVLCSQVLSGQNWQSSLGLLNVVGTTVHLCLANVCYLLRRKAD